MSGFLQMSEAVIFAAVYATALLMLMLMNRRDFKRAPEKGERYQRLPLRYKMACRFLVVPLFAAGILNGLLFIPAILSFVWLEGACVRWYKDAGLWP